jgi:hypothetical protein
VAGVLEAGTAVRDVDPRAERGSLRSKLELVLLPLLDMLLVLLAFAVIRTPAVFVALPGMITLVISPVGSSKTSKTAKIGVTVPTGAGGYEVTALQVHSRPSRLAGAEEGVRFSSLLLSFCFF